MKISIIIPTLNEELYIGQLLSSIVAQGIKPHEVIVVDSGNTDKTESVVKLYKDRLPISYVPADGKGAARARNTGAKRATGDFVYFVDSDCTLPPENLRKITDAVKKQKLDVALMPGRMSSGKHWYTRSGIYFMNGYVRLMRRTPWPIGFSCFMINRELFMQSGGFDATIPVMEDYDLILRLHRAGGKIGYVKQTHFDASDRRFVNRPDRIATAFKAEVYRYTHGLKVHKDFKYEMGGKPAPKSNKKSN